MVLVTEIENTLWGMVLEGKVQFEHKSERPIHISMAALDTSTKHDEFVPIMVHHGDKAYIMCTLSAPNYLQQSLDLEINKGEVVSFSLNSNGVVHLTGYYVQEELMDDSQMGDFMEEGHDHENCQHPHDLNGYGEEEDDDDDDEDEDDDDDEDEDDEDDDEEDGSMNSEDYDIEAVAGRGDFDEDDDDDDDEDEDEDEQEIELPVTNGNKRKLEEKSKLNKNKKLKKEKSEDEDDEEEPPKLVKQAEKPQKVNKNNEENKKKEKQNNKAQEPALETKTVNGVQVKDLKIGNGPEAKRGKYVHVYYQGKLKQNGKQFDACQNGKPFKFRLGSGEVIKGWDIGVAGMKVGSKRVLTIPPHLAYGNQKLGGIPPNSTLVFEVELKAIS